MDLSNMPPLFSMVHTKKYDDNSLNTIIKDDVYVNARYNKTLPKRLYQQVSIEPPLPSAPFSAVIDAFIGKHNAKQNTTSIAEEQQLEQKEEDSIQADTITIPAKSYRLQKRLAEPSPNIEISRADNKKRTSCTGQAYTKKRPSRKKQKTTISTTYNMIELLSSFPIHNINAIWQQPYSPGIYLHPAMNPRVFEEKIRITIFSIDIPSVRAMLRHLMKAYTGSSYASKYGIMRIPISDCEQMIKAFTENVQAHVPSDNINPMILCSYQILTNLTNTAKSLSNTCLEIHIEYSELLAAGLLYLLHFIKQSRSNSSGEPIIPSQVTCTDEISFHLNNDHLLPQIADIFNSIGALSMIDLSYYLSTHLQEASTRISSNITIPNVGNLLIIPTIQLDEKSSIIARAFVEKLTRAFNQKNSQFAAFMGISSLPEQFRPIHIWNNPNNTLTFDAANILLTCVNATLQHANLRIPGTEIPPEDLQDDSILKALNKHINPMTLSVARRTLFQALMSIDSNGKHAHINISGPHIKEIFYDLSTKMKQIISECNGSSILVSMGMAAFIHVAFNIYTTDIISIGAIYIKQALFLLDNIAATIRNQTSHEYIDCRNRHENQFASCLIEASIDRDCLIMIKNLVSKPLYNRIPIRSEQLCILRRILEISFDFPTLAVYTQPIMSAYRTNFTANDPSLHLNDVFNISKLIDFALGTTLDTSLSTDEQISIINQKMTIAEMLSISSKYQQVMHAYNITKLNQAFALLTSEKPIGNHQYLGFCAIEIAIAKNILQFLEHVLNVEFCSNKVESYFLRRHLIVCRNILTHYIPTPAKVESPVFLPHSYTLFLQQIFEAALIYEKIIKAHVNHLPSQELDAQYQKLRSVRINKRNIKLLSNTSDPITKALCENVGEIMLYNAFCFLLYKRNINTPNTLISLDKRWTFVFSFLLEHLSRIAISNPSDPLFKDMPNNLYGSFLAHDQQLTSMHIPWLLTTMRSICNKANIPVPAPEYNGDIESAASTATLIRSSFSFDELFIIKLALDNIAEQTDTSGRSIDIKINVQDVSTKIHALYTKIISLESNPLSKPLLSLEEIQDMQIISQRHSLAVACQQKTVYLTSKRLLHVSLLINKILDTLSTGDEALLVDTICYIPDKPMPPHNRFSDIIIKIGHKSLVELHTCCNGPNAPSNKTFMFIPDNLMETTLLLINTCKEHPALRFLIPQLKHSILSMHNGERLRILVGPMKNLLNIILPH